MPTTEENFQAALEQAKWDDPVPTQAYADWLDENNRNDEADKVRSKFWMVQFACKHHTYAKWHDPEYIRKEYPSWTEEQIEEDCKPIDEDQATEWYDEWMQFLECHTFNPRGCPECNGSGIATSIPLDGRHGYVSDDCRKCYGTGSTFVRGESWYLRFDLPYDFTEYSAEMWGHFEKLTGKKPLKKYLKERPPFRCAC